jgi:hypothetical protein
VALEFLLAASQGCLIGLNFMEAPANFSQFLSAVSRCSSSSTWLSVMIDCSSVLACGRIPPRRYRLGTGVFSVR